MPQNVTFPKLKPQWIFDRVCVQFFATIDGEQVLKCLVSGEALQEHFGARDFSMEEAMRAFLDHREDIEAVAREKILKGKYKRGDEVLLRMADFPRKTATTAHPLPHERGLRVVIAPTLSEDPKLADGVGEANLILERDLAGSTIQATATWDLVPTPPHVPRLAHARR